VTLVKHEFGRAATVYLRSYLDHNERWGKRLGKLLARRDLEAGTVWSFVPPESSPETLADLREGALYANTPILVDEGGHRWQRKHDPWKDPEVIEWIEGLLAGPGSSARIVCSEDVYATRTDRWVTEYPGTVFFCGDDVYAYATPDGPVGGALDPIADAAGDATGNPSVGMVTTLPPDLEIGNRQSLSEQTLEKAAAAAIAVIVGAWDEEGLLFWEPARGA
jgi:hypothetical protein